MKLRFQDVTSFKEPASSNDTVHLPFNPDVLLQSSHSWKLEGNPEFEGSGGTQKWGRISATQSDPTSLGLSAQHWHTWESPLCVCSMKPMWEHDNRSKTAGFPFPPAGKWLPLSGIHFPKIFIMRQHGKLSLVNLIKLETNEYMTL